MRVTDIAAELVARSNRLGADPRNTNYAGGNTSAKGTGIDPATGGEVELLWVKGSGGDLGTLTEAGLAVLRLDRLRSLVDVYPGVDREDEMVAAFDYCLHGRGGAAPSIDTAMHGLVDAAHVDHLHPDAGIALATAADGEALTKQIFGDRVVWIPWRRPGFQLGLDIAEIKERNPRVGVQMIDVRGVDQAVHRGVDRRRGAATPVQAVVERRDHLVLAFDTGVDVDQRAHPVEPQHGQPVCRQGAEISAGTLDPQQVHRRPGDGIDIGALRRGVTARVVGVLRIGAQSVGTCDQIVDG